MDSKSFGERQQLLFSTLANAEKTIKGTSLEQPDCDYVKKKIPVIRPKDTRMKIAKFRGRESIFKRPEAPIDKCLPQRSTPDFQVSFL